MVDVRPCRPIAALITACFLVASGVRPAVGAPAGVDDEGRYAPYAPAPAGAWTVQGGNPARTRGAETPAPVRAPELAWTWRPKGRLAGEPLVWGDYVVVEDRLGPGDRALVLLDRATGATLGREVQFRTDRDLAPSLWGERVVVRAAGDILHGYSLNQRGLRRTWVRRGEGALGRPLLVGNTAYFVEGGALVAQSFGKRKPEWTFGRDYLGPLSIADGVVLGLQERQNGGWYAIEVDAQTGTAGVPELLPTPEVSGDVGEQTTIMSIDGGVYVFSEQELRLGPHRSKSMTVLDELRDGPTSSPGFLTGENPVPAARHATGTLACSGEQGWVRLHGRLGDLLAAGAHHDVLLSRTAAPAITPTVTYLGGLAIDSESLDVLWGLPTRGTLIPVRGGVLAIGEGGRELQAYLAKRDVSDAPIELAAIADGWVGEEGLAVLASGTIVRGELRVKAVDGELRLEHGAGRRAESWPLAEVAFLADDGQLLRSSGLSTFLQACVDLAEEAQRELLEDNERAYVPTMNPGLIEEALELALRVGAKDQLVERLESGYDKAVDRDKPSAKRSEDVRELLDGVAGLPLEILWGWAAQVVAAEGPPALERRRRDLLEAVLDLAPEHGPARDAIAARVPAEAGLESASDAELEELLDWLEFVRATDRVPVTTVLPPDGKTLVDTTADERTVGDAAVGWRNDLVGHRSESMLLISSLETPGAAARILSMGELMIENLESWFADLPVVRGIDPPPIEVHLFGTKAEYLRVCSGGKTHGGLSWTAGHFDQERGQSRLYMPRGEEGFEDALLTFLHELTHHWLALRCPAFTGNQVRRSAGGDQPGYWIVEGFACLAEGLVLDVDDWSAEIGGRLGDRTPVVASCDPGVLIPWETLYALPHLQLGSLAALAPSDIPVPLTLGRYYRAGGISLFYSQAAATARYLFEADGGAHRKALIAYLTAYYSADRDALDIRKAFGMSPDELGAKVVAWSKTRLDDRLGRR